MFVRMGTELVKPDLMSPAVSSLTTVLSPLGTAAGSFARTIACVVAERKRLAIMDRAITLDYRLRERQVVLAAEFQERDSLRRTQLELTRIESGERIAFARMDQAFRAVDALLTSQAESEIRQLHADYEKTKGALAIDKFVVENVFHAVETVLNVNALALNQSRISERNLGRALDAATRSSTNPHLAPMALEAMAVISRSLSDAIGARHASQAQLTAAVRDHIGTILVGWSHR